MATHKEIGFEEVICDHLGANGWLYTPGSGATSDAAYDRVRALHAPDLIAWAAETQPRAWAELISKQGEAAVLDRVRKSLDERGTLEVLRRGVEFTGLKAPLILAQFRPAMGMNPEIMARYAAKQALESPATRNGLLEVLMGPGQLYEALREKAAASA